MRLAEGELRDDPFVAGQGEALTAPPTLATGRRERGPLRVGRPRFVCVRGTPCGVRGTRSVCGGHVLGPARQGGMEGVDGRVWVRFPERALGTDGGYSPPAIGFTASNSWLRGALSEWVLDVSFA